MSSNDGVARQNQSLHRLKVNQPPFGRKMLILRASGSGAGMGANNLVWPHVESELERAYKLGGIVELIAGTASDRGVRLGVTLTMDAHPGNFRIVYYRPTPLTERSDRREWWEPGDESFRGTANFSDHEWDGRTVCKDLNVAIEMFRDFFANQDLTEVSLRQLRSEWERKPRH